jgi:type IV pilus assembly protein PilP
VTRRFQTLAAPMTAVVVLATGVAVAQTPAAPPAAPGTPDAAASTPASEPQAGYSYDPQGRRDPFVSLMRRGNDAARNEAGERPSGLGGITVGELTLKGTMQGRDGYMALVQGPDLKTYIVKPGDKLFDGSIRAISANAMVLMQQVNDPLSLEKQREVRKVFRQVDEVK